MCFALLDCFEQSNTNEFAVFLNVCAFTPDLNITKKISWTMVALNAD